jgi:hypothetical protein
MKLESHISESKMIQPEYLHVLLSWMPDDSKARIIPGDIRELANLPHDGLLFNAINMAL